MINSNYNKIDINIPTPVLVIDDLIESSFLDKTTSEFLTSKNKLTFYKQQNDRDQIRYMALPSIKLTELFLSKEFSNLLYKETGFRWDLNKKVWIQLRVMDSTAPALDRHTDEIGVGHAVCLFYINKDWLIENGGELNFHRNFNEPDINSVKLYPVFNRLVFFEANQMAIHSVNKVYDRHRYVIVSEWIKK